MPFKQFSKYVMAFTPYCKRGSSISIERLATHKHGRPRLLNDMRCLGLVLMYTRAKGSYFVLDMIFGVTNAPISLWLGFRMSILVKVIQNNSYASI